MNKTAIRRKVISSKDYSINRMKHMSAEALYYLDLAKRAPNAILKKCYLDVSDIYHKRYLWYFNKDRSNSSFETIIKIEN